MKLMIDIPEEVVKAIQNGEDYRYDIHAAIAQGIFVSTDGEMISREVLRKAFLNRIYYFNKLSWDEANAIIDSAPTVEPEITNDDLQSAMTESHHLGYELAETKFKRSQGEWICTVKSNFPQYEPDEYRCSICNGVGYLLDKFCKHCGSEMKVINNE